MGNIMNMLGLGMDMGVNFDNLSMDQKRKALGSMFDPMEAGRERLRAMTAPTTPTTTGMNPMMLQTLMQGLLSQP